MSKQNELAQLADAVTVDGGNVGIGTSSPDTPLEIQIGSSGNALKLSSSTDGISVYLAFEQQESGTKHVRGRVRAASNGADGGLIFETGSSGSMSERMRIDSTGNLLVGKTTAALATAGTAIRGDNAGLINSARAGVVLELNRLSSDGNLAVFYKNGSSIGALTARDNDLAIHSTTTNHVGLVFGNTRIEPANNYGTTSNNTVDLGNTDRKFQDIYATNGTIQTSDFNEKQDIASLTATEMLVGKRISALFKTFRWKDSVVEKGDNARTHTGIIAQDVQAAFTAEGLDAGDYALFISSTWWEHDVEVPAVEAVAEVIDEDGNVITEAVEAVDAYTRTDNYHVQAEAPESSTEVTRMGIRYPELLSFVAAYNEQRFASIEARLTALEA